MSLALNPGMWSSVALAATVGFMSVAVISDVQHHRISNRITYPAIVAGLVLGFLSGGLDGLVSSFGGFFLGFGLMFIGFMFDGGNGIGGGDVKLTGALGALVGLSTTSLGLLYMCLCAGAMAFAIIIWKGKFLASMRNMVRFIFTSLLPFMETEKLSPENSVPFPLGVAIVAGFAWAIVETHFGAAPLLEINL